MKECDQRGLHDSSVTGNQHYFPPNRDGSNTDWPIDGYIARVEKRVHRANTNSCGKEILL